MRPDGEINGLIIHPGARVWLPSRVPGSDGLGAATRAAFERSYETGAEITLGFLISALVGCRDKGIVVRVVDSRDGRYLLEGLRRVSLRDPGTELTVPGPGPVPDELQRWRKEVLDDARWPPWWRASLEAVDQKGLEQWATSFGFIVDKAIQYEMFERPDRIARIISSLLVRRTAYGPYWDWLLDRSRNGELLEGFDGPEVPADGTSSILQAHLVPLGIEGSLVSCLRTKTRVLWGVRCTTAQSPAQTWMILRDAHARTGHWPVIAGTRDDLDRLQECQSTEYESGGGASPRKFNELSSESQVRKLQLKLRRRQRGRSHVLLVPGRRPFDHICFGGFNDCPEDHVHAEKLEDWGTEYGAELHKLTADSLELAVARPPQEDKTCAALASSLLSYCPELQTIDNAARMAQSSVWYFWWD